MVPEIPSQFLPQYTFVPGITPRPSEGDLLRLRHQFLSRGYTLYRGGRELFNRGYYWESHELWEEAWGEENRVGQLAVLLKGKIKLAACGVKILQGNSNGASRHARRAHELFQGLIDQLSTGAEIVPGPCPLDDLNRMSDLAQSLVDQLPIVTPEQRAAVTHGGVPIIGPIA
ncbi:DUF309 domain-containing protein [Planctomicrobium sp. SH668]|uniref:DUF309 domain-containing protein n=1 Tax=Planctomicrobium sp. SH668 TaxID=3448126 RepID=UPI003F5B928A